MQGAYENIQQNIQSAQKSANERVLHAELDSKKKLIMRREEIIDDVMKLSRAKSLNLSRAINTKNGF